MDEEPIAFKRFEVWLDEADQDTIKSLGDAYGFSAAGTLRFCLKYFHKHAIDTGKLPVKSRQNPVQEGL